MTMGCLWNAQVTVREPQSTMGLDDLSVDQQNGQSIFNVQLVLEIYSRPQKIMVDRPFQELSVWANAVCPCQIKGDHIRSKVDNV